MDRLDSPLDARILWDKFRAFLFKTAQEEAVRCANAKDTDTIRKHQGGHAMCLRLVGEMDRMVDEERHAETSAADNSD